MLSRRTNIFTLGRTQAYWRAQARKKSTLCLAHFLLLSFLRRSLCIALVVPDLTMETITSFSFYPRSQDMAVKDPFRWKIFLSLTTVLKDTTLGEMFSLLT